jgi:hypothetical protein
MRSSDDDQPCDVVGQDCDCRRKFHL